MKNKYYIRNLKNGEYFLGASPYPVFGDFMDGAVSFDSESEAVNRLNEEFEMFPNRFEGMVIEIIKTFVSYESKN